MYIATNFDGPRPLNCESPWVSMAVTCLSEMAVAIHENMISYSETLIWSYAERHDCMLNEFRSLCLSVWDDCPEHCIYESLSQDNTLGVFASYPNVVRAWIYYCIALADTCKKPPNFGCIDSHPVQLLGSFDIVKCLQDVGFVPRSDSTSDDAWYVQCRPSTDAHGPLVTTHLTFEFLSTFEHLESIAKVHPITLSVAIFSMMQAIAGMRLLPSHTYSKAPVVLSAAKELRRVAVSLANNQLAVMDPFITSVPYSTPEVVAAVGVAAGWLVPQTIRRRRRTLAGVIDCLVPHYDQVFRVNLNRPEFCGGWLV